MLCSLRSGEIKCALLFAPSVAGAAGVAAWINSRSGVVDYGGERPTRDGFDLNRCTPVDAESVDCTDVFRAAFGVPALQRLVVSTSVTMCAIAEITTITNAAALDASDGIGAYYAHAPGSDNRSRFVPKADLVYAAKGK